MERVRITFRTNKDTADKLDELAEADGRDRNSMLNRIVELYIKRSATNPFNFPATKAGK